MKKLFTLVCALVLGSALSFAQTQTPPASGSTDTTKSDTGKKSKKGSKKSHKGGKKSKKSNPETTATPK